MKRNCIWLVLLFSCMMGWAANKEKVSVFSNSMQRTVSVVMVVPERVSCERFPVVYLLHGYSGDENTWCKIRPDLDEIADQYQMIFVCPDGQNSWYWDSPLHRDVCYETFISQELVQYVDMHYPTLAGRQARAITGLSMGGHGALWNAIRHSDVFGAAGSMSGGLDIRPFPDSWEMSRQLGTLAANKEVWDSHTVMEQVDKLSPDMLALIIDCGVDDFFYEVNLRFHEELLKRKIGHDFIARPGAHNAAYWKNSILYQLLFFNQFFAPRQELVH